MGESPRWAQVTALFLTTAVALAVAVFDEVAALATLPLIVFGVAFVQGRSWAVFALFATSIALGHGLLAGALPPWLVLAMLPVLIAVGMSLPNLVRFDRLATLLALLLSFAAGLFAADLWEGVAHHYAQKMAPLLEPAPSIRGALSVVHTNVEPLFSAPPAVPLPPLTCRGGDGKVLYVRRTIFEFSSDSLQPLSYGPRIAERLLTYAHSKRAITRALQGRSALLKQCYRWARYVGSRNLAGMVRIAGEVGVWGQVRVFGVSMPDGGHGEALLRQCSARVLKGMHLWEAREVITRFDATIRFSPSIQGPPDRVPSRPKAPATEEARWRRCLRLPPEVSRQHVMLKTPTLRINDFDADQHRREQERACQSSKCRMRVPSLRSRSTCRAAPRLPKETLLRSLRYNMGAYRACYRQALGRQPGLGGTIVLWGRINGSGVTEKAEVRRSSAGDNVLHSCLVRAVSEVSYPPSGADHIVEFFYPLQLNPSSSPELTVPARMTVAKLQALAHAQLTMGDGPSALRSYSALIRAQPEAPQACWWHLGALKAVHLQAPWGGPRFEAAVHGLRVHLRRHPQRSFSQCADQGTAQIAKLAMERHREARHLQSDLTQEAMHWYELALSSWSA
ncbi:MAG: AgmX/PglI C-terminal domain-containing protein, partial [Deltaproteobacteria bacterium]|nr:AgmX/PglI C-terminal domain-containing protein [Deltaproteobacteria bacterium]